MARRLRGSQAARRLRQRRDKARFGQGKGNSLSKPANAAIRAPDGNPSAALAFYPNVRKGN